jgi:hypothetical protein
MADKCRICDILLDVPCTQPGCPGHRNARHGEICVACATQERARFSVWQDVSTLVSSLDDCDAECYEEL